MYLIASTSQHSSRCNLVSLRFVPFVQHLSLCLEPEAACLHVERNPEHDHRNIYKWEIGTKLMVLDCGGGTIDITTHHVVRADPVGLEELEEPVGGPWGSTTADAKFKQFIKVGDGRGRYRSFAHTTFFLGDIPVMRFHLRSRLYKGRLATFSPIHRLSKAIVLNPTTDCRG